MHRTGRLVPDAADEVLALARAAEVADGVAPLAEEVLHRVRDDPAPVTHLLAHDPSGRLAGYGQVHRTAADGATAELVVHPRARRHGLGRALVTSSLAEAGQAAPEATVPGPDVAEATVPGPDVAEATVPGPDVAAVGRPPVPLRVWAHGDHPGARALARSLGFARTRVLHRLRRSLTAPIPAPVLPTGVSLRPFRPGADDTAWLAVNARAFADHPEQGRWTAEDLRWRLAEPWFDPAGFLLAVRPEPVPETLLGFHWTKVHHPDSASDPDPDPDRGRGADQGHDLPLGEVYVLGVDPAAHGLGLGTALTLAGLRHLHERGLTQVMLYVDDSNQAAVALYRKLGFAPWSVDVTYTRPG